MSKITTVVKERAKTLAALIAYHQERYHEQDAPEISDEAYDSLVLELRGLIAEYPSLKGLYGAIDAVGGRPDNAFVKVKHRVRQWSFDNVFTDDELVAWEERLMRVLEKRVREKKRSRM